MARLIVDDYLIMMARLVALRGTCLRRQVGCVLVDERNRVLATGYNGAARGQPHCGEPGCVCGGQRYRSGEGLDACLAIHAEQNALLQCKDSDAVNTANVTVTPCVSCAKLLLNTGVGRIVAWAPYAHDTESLKIFEDAGVAVRIFTDQDQRHAISGISNLIAP